MGNTYSASAPELEKPWRKVKWGGKKKMRKKLRKLQPSLEPLRILLCGPAGAGKSCFINSIQKTLFRRNIISAQENSAAIGESFTLSIKTHKMCEDKYYPFVFCDIMGLEPADAGIQTEDIIKVLQGHILDDYIFNPRAPIKPDNRRYKQRPESHDKIHCVVSIVPRMDPSVINQMNEIRSKASQLNIPHVVVLTKVDKACEVVNRDLKKLYRSKKIKEKVDECSQKLGIPVNNIYPVKNYHMEITQDVNADLLILMALKDIMIFASNHVEKLCKAN